MVIITDQFQKSPSSSAFSPKEKSSPKPCKEIIFEGPLQNKIRPKTIQEYIGQDHIKDMIGLAIEAAKQRNESLDHILLYGPPGLGKTTLASVLAHTMQAHMIITSAPALEKPRDIIGILMTMQPGDILFIDEIHRLNRITEEILYPAMEDYTLDRVIGKGQTAKVLKVPLPRFTLIGATTKVGSLTNPLRDRFGIIHRLDYYQQNEICEIVLRSAQILNISIEKEAALLIAKSSRATPRIANRLLKRIRDFAQVHKEPIIKYSTAEKALKLFKIDSLGLDHTDLKLIKLMVEKFDGGPVGIDTLSVGLGESPKTIEDVYEPYLVKIGFLQRTNRGRVVTPSAYKHIKI